MVMGSGDHFYHKTTGDLHVLYRCDMKNNNGECKSYSYDDMKCNDEGYEEWGLNFIFPSFDFTEGPVKTDCPGATEGSQECMEYCNENKQKCVIVDSKGRYVKYGQIIYRYKDYVPVLSDFAWTLCDGETPVPAPEVNPCVPNPPSSPSSHPSSSSISLPSVLLLVTALLMLFTF